jgi:receptor protein-tyrosine kinase
MADNSAHLIERAAARLQQTGALPVPGLLTDVASLAPRAIPPQFPPRLSDALDAPHDGNPATANEAAAWAPDPDSSTRRMLDIPTLERGGLVIGRKSRTRISEEFRIAMGHILRTLQEAYTAGSGSANLIMVTSARPGEGKSFTALNLAGSLAQQSQREVLLIDVDAKQRPMTYELGLTDASGLLDLVANPSLKVEDLLVRTAIPNLSFLPIGSRLPDNSEMLASRPVSAVVERLGRRFANRLIIIDAPPCLSTSDPSGLAPIVGQTLMVVEAERTQRNELEAALDLIRVCPKITLLLNKIQLTTSYTFGAYHYFGTYS